MIGKQERQTCVMEWVSESHRFPEVESYFAVPCLMACLPCPPPGLQEPQVCVSQPKGFIVSVSCHVTLLPIKIKTSIYLGFFAFPSFPVSRFLSLPQSFLYKSFTSVSAFVPVLISQALRFVIDHLPTVSSFLVYLTYSVF